MNRTRWLTGHRAWRRGTGGADDVPSFLGQFTLWFVELITELKIVAEPVNCLPPHFPSFSDRSLQVLTQMAALLETPSSRVPGSSLWPRDSGWAKGMWRSGMATSRSYPVRKLLALYFLSFPFLEAEIHSPQPHGQGQGLWDSGVKTETCLFLGLTGEKHPSLLFIALYVGASLLEQLSLYLN